MTNQNNNNRSKKILIQDHMISCLKGEIELNDLLPLIVAAGIPEGLIAESLMELLLMVKNARKPKPTGALMSLDKFLIALEVFDIKLSKVLGKHYMGEDLTVSLSEMHPDTDDEEGHFYTFTVSKHGELVSSVVNWAVLTKVELFWKMY